MRNEYEIRGDMTVIFLSKRDGTRYETIIDTVDLPRAKEFTGKWHAYWSKESQCYYVCGNIRVNGKKTIQSFHRWIMKAPKGIEVDHIHHNGLDNRRSVNLRYVDGSQNKQNRRGAQRNSKTGIRGVSLHNPTGKWIVQVCVNGKHYFCGLFENIKDAENKAIEARKKLMPYSKENMPKRVDWIAVKVPEYKKSKSKSGIKGIYYHLGKWRVRPKINGKMVEVGVFEELEDAKKALNKIMEAN
jgi:hypothetical protein